MIMENKLVQALRSFLGFDKDISEENKIIIKMRAKVKDTGKIIDVEFDGDPQFMSVYGVNDTFRGPDGEIYTESELDFDNLYPDENLYPNWQKIKVQASIAAMQGILANNARDETIENMVNLSIELADTLVEKLKKKLIKSE